MQDENLKQAIELSKCGLKDEARKQLQEVVNADSQNEQAWLWLADTYSDNQNRIMILTEFLKFKPDSQLALKGLSKLKEQEVAEESFSSLQEFPGSQNNNDSQEELLDLYFE